MLELTELNIIFRFTEYISIYKTKVNDYSQSGHRPTGEGGGHGTFMCRQFDLLVMVLITDEKITRVIRKVIEFFAKREERTDEEKETELKVLAAALAIFIFSNMIILVRVLTK